jgi:hypothetical protein
MAVELLQGEILEEYRTVVDATKPKNKNTAIKTDVSPCTDPAGCSEGCTGGTTDQKKPKHRASVAGWFDPPAL